MNLLLKAVAGAAFGCLIGQMCGCVSSSSLVDIWHDPSFQDQPLGNMLVISVRKDATKRRIWEDAFTGELAKHGVAATSSYSLFPDAPPDTNKVIAAAQTNGFDGILVVLRLPTETDKQYIQGYTTTEKDVRYTSNIQGYTTTEQDVRYNRNNSAYYGPYWPRYWMYYYREIEHPGYTDSQTVDIRAIDVTTTGKGGRLIWSATSRTPDPGSVTDVQSGIAGLVTAELTQRSIIRPKK
ncbi:MAG: hypothetical protein JW768_12205 [Chitinispirillaceae bacterium]|nr:hypothetical protein [Chitinispirillaceae bacterium]